MPNSPFGLAYGIGAGLSGVPGAIQQGKEQALAMNMRNLQNAQMQQNWNEEQAQNAALSMPAPPPPEETVNTPGNMGTLPQTTPEGEPIEYSGSAAAPTQEMQNMGAVGASTKTVPGRYSTPFAEQAARLSQAAERLQQMGMGRAAFKLQQEAAQYGQMHMEKLGASAARALISGNTEEALPAMRELGYHPSSISKDEDGNPVLNMPDGSTQVLNKAAIAALASGGKIADFLQKQAQWEASIEGRQAVAESRAKSLEARTKAMLEGRLEQISAQGDNAKEVARIRATAPGKAGGDTAYWKNVKATADQLAAEASLRGERLDPTEAVRLAREQIPPPGAGHSTMSQNQQVLALQKQQKALQDTYGRKVFKADADPTSPYSRHQALQKKIDDIMGGGPKPSAIPAARPASLPPIESRPVGFKGALKDGTPVHWDGKGWVRD